MNTLKTALFLLSVPGTVLIIIPSTIILPIERNAFDMGLFAWLALPSWAIGLGMLLWCAADFVRKGHIMDSVNQVRIIFAAKTVLDADTCACAASAGEGCLKNLAAPRKPLG